MVDNIGGHEVQKMNGGKIAWKNPPRPNVRCRWSKRDTSGRLVTGSFRHIAHLNRLNNLAVKKGWKSGIVIIQPAYNKTVAASAGTHDFDACVDLYIPGVDWWKQQAFLRANGLGCWYRHPPSFPYHIHGMTIPPQSGQVRADDFRDGGFKVGLYVDGGYSQYGSLRSSSQLTDYYNHAFGLSGQHDKNSDHSWFPDNIKGTIFNLGKYVSVRAK